jgi:hypothetical protein
MDEKRAQAAKRLAKKLTALRKTLRKDEREILDQIVAKTGAEVEGHMVAGQLYGLLDNGAYGVVDSNFD